MLSRGIPYKNVKDADEDNQRERACDWQNSNEFINLNFESFATGHFLDCDPGWNRHKRTLFTGKS